MAKYEDLAEKGVDTSANVQKDEFDNAVIKENGKVCDLIVPILVLIIATIVAMLYVGGLFTGALPAL